MNMTKDELRARIIATANPKPVALDLPEWGPVFVKHLLVGELDAIPSDGEKKTATARGIARVLCTADGELLFDSTSEADLAYIAGLTATTLSKINAAMAKVSPTTAEGAAELGKASPPATDSSST